MSEKMGTGKDTPTLSLQDEREKRMAHNSGSAFCEACDHKWVAVAPLGTVWLECPKCSLHYGRFGAPVASDSPRLDRPPWLLKARAEAKKIIEK